jgi:A/G-specific adenine glycosylase
LPQRIRPEHRIFWRARPVEIVAEREEELRNFFRRYARNNLRSLPWRKKGTKPFQLMVAEILLVQTKAEDVAKVWPTLIATFPTPERLAGAHTKKLRRLLRPLGLQEQRTRALRKMSKDLVKRFKGQVPRAIPELLSIPYVGLYVACALASFKFKQRAPIVDANVMRVLGRLKGLGAKKDLRRSPEIWRIAWEILPKRAIAEHNYGLLDFAAQICKSRTPQCFSCSLNATCVYAQMEHRRT